MTPLAVSKTLTTDTARMNQASFTPKLVAFDLDGTLAESKQSLTTPMGRLVADLLRKMPVAVMSGAGFPQFKTQFFSGLPEGADFASLYIFPTNAAECFVFDHENGWRPIYDLAFSDEERTRVLAAIEDALKDVGLDATPQPIWGERIEDRGAQITFSGLGQQAPLKEKEAWDPTGTKRKSLRDALAKRLPDFSEAVGGATSVDITRKGINKAYGVRKLAELTSVSIAEMLYVGDALQEGGNDAVVLATGIKAEKVSGPDETAVLIAAILSKYGLY
jgi:phosphomannomutase